VFDAHVHAAPDIVDRRHDDLQTAQAYRDAGFTGFVLKAHYESTVGRAAAAASVSGLQVYGGVALNQHVGGVNPAAVEAALAAGGRVVWLPTADSHTQQSAGLPRLCDQGATLSAHAYALPPVDPDAMVAASEVISMVAEHDVVLATGHISEAECRWVVERATALGVGRMLLTHPSYTVPAIGPAQIEELADAGAHVEITAFQLLHQTGCTPAMLARVARAAGSRLVLSSDAGQVDSPDPPEALSMLLQALASEGLDTGWLSAAASDVPAALFAP